MKTATKNMLKSLMEMTQNAYKEGTSEAVRISDDKDLSAEARLRRTQAAHDSFSHSLSIVRDRLKEEKAKALSELERVKDFNSKRRLANSEYQSRLILEGNFIKSIPESMGPDILKDRCAVFYGDDLARQYLTAVIEKANETKQNPANIVVASEILPDIYGLQSQMIEKIYSALDNKVASVQSNYYSKVSGAFEQEKAETVALFMEGLFTGISDYMDSLPEVLDRPEVAHIKGVDFEGIPAYAMSSEDLNINFSMYRKS